MLWCGITGNKDCPLLEIPAAGDLFGKDGYPQIVNAMDDWLQVSIDRKS